MVDPVGSCSRTGLRDWLLQRVTALILASYFVILLIFFIMHTPIHFLQWQSWFAQRWVRVYTLLSILSLLLHARIGVWVVLTDYVKHRATRLCLEILTVVVSIVYGLWCIDIIWGL